MIATDGTRLGALVTSGGDASVRAALPKAEVPDIPAATLAAVTVVVPVHNSPSVTRACLRALHERTAAQVRLVVVDDASDAHTAEMLRVEVARMERQAQLETFPDNRRYTAAINRGFALAFDGGARYAVALNSDVLVTPGWLERLLRVAMQPGVSVVCPYSNNTANLTIDMSRGASYLETAERVAAYAQKQALAAPPAVTPVGACMLVTRDSWERHGPFDPSVSPAGVGGYGEECWFWAFQPHSCYTAPDAYVYHEGGASYGDEKEAAEREAVKRFLTGHVESDGRQVSIGALYRAERDKLRRVDPMQSIKGSLPSIRIESDEKPRVAFVIGGIEICGGILALVNVANRLCEYGIEATIGYRQERGGAEWRRMPTRFAPVQYEKTSDWLRNGGFERGLVIATAFYTGQMTSDLVATFPHLSGHAFVQDREDLFRRPGGDMEYNHPGRIAAYLSLVRRGAVVNSNWVRDSMIRDHGIDPQALEYIPIGVDPDLFYDRGLRAEAPVRVLAFSRPETPRRGHKTLVEVYRALRARYGESVELCTYDRHPGPDCPIDKHLGRMPQAKLALEMARAHILIEPSFSQGWGMPGQEMMASGGALVSTDNGGIHNYGKHERDCLIGGTDAASLVALASRLIEDADLRASLGKAARVRAEFLSWDRVAQAWAKWVRSKMGGR